MGDVEGYQSLPREEPQSSPSSTSPTATPQASLMYGCGHASRPLPTSTSMHCLPQTPPDRRTDEATEQERSLLVDTNVAPTGNYVYSLESVTSYFIMISVSRE